MCKKIENVNILMPQPIPPPHNAFAYAATVHGKAQSLIQVKSLDHALNFCVDNNNMMRSKVVYVPWRNTS